MQAGCRFPSCRAFEFRRASVTRFTPSDLSELREVIGEALAADEPLELVAGATKRELGRPLQLPHTLDLSQLAGIRDYQPSELILTAGSGTPLAEIEGALASARQMIAFEPPNWGELFALPGSAAGRSTIGGALACNLSGPRRIKVGAARDHFLGFRGVSGRAEVFKAGGKVVKNVTGYDLAKLMAGSHGTLAALEEVTIRIMPRPEVACTVVLCGLGPEAGVERLSRALASPHEVSGAAYLPTGITLPTPFSGLRNVAALRLEGPAPSVAFRRERLLADLAADCESTVLNCELSEVFWSAIGNATPLAPAADRAVWRVSVAPSRGAELANSVDQRLDAVWYLDWGGGLLWVAVAGAEDGGAALLRNAIRGKDGRGTGHATLISGSPSLRQAVPVFEPQAPALANLAQRIKENFDPRRILNPGRMTEGC
ncbi:MAG: FAD-binding protein [Alphaproteobacteria bacterium]|nr:FAD-binding protein [Alphaproteobacteria bacterium]